MPFLTAAQNRDIQRRNAPGQHVQPVYFANAKLDQNIGEAIAQARQVGVGQDLLRLRSQEAERGVVGNLIPQVPLHGRLRNVDAAAWCDCLLACIRSQENPARPRS